MKKKIKYLGITLANMTKRTITLKYAMIFKRIIEVGQITTVVEQNFSD